VPGIREIKGSVLGRLPYYLVWQLPIALPSFLPSLLHSTLLFLLLLPCNYFLYLLLYPLNRRISST